MTESTTTFATNWARKIGLTGVGIPAFVESIIDHVKAHRAEAYHDGVRAASRNLQALEKETAP